jgi:hypothetical protein
MEPTMIDRQQAYSATTRWKAEQAALDAFLAKKAEIDTILARLAALSENNFNLHPNKIGTGDVGILEYYASILRRVSDMAFREGECAEEEARQ